MSVANTIAHSSRMATPQEVGCCLVPDSVGIDLHGDTLQLFYESIGKAAHPIPCTLQHDMVVTLTVLLTAFGLIIFTVNAKGYMLTRQKDFFQVRNRENMFSNRADTELKSGWLVVVFLSIQLGVLFGVYAEHAGFMEGQNPYAKIAMASVFFALAYMVKYLLTQWVNYIFFDSNRARLWAESYLFLTLLYSLALLPITLLTVLGECNVAWMQKSALVLLVVVEILLFYKCFRIFFGNLAGLLHLFLYLCALEFLSMLIFWRGIHWVSTGLTTFIL